MGKPSQILPNLVGVNRTLTWIHHLLIPNPKPKRKHSRHRHSNQHQPISKSYPHHNHHHDDYQHHHVNINVELWNFFILSPHSWHHDTLQPTRSVQASAHHCKWRSGYFRSLHIISEASYLCDTWMFGCLFFCMQELGDVCTKTSRNNVNVENQKWFMVAFGETPYFEFQTMNVRCQSNKMNIHHIMTY